MSLNTLPFFDDIQDALQAYSAAECHGLLAAFICTDPKRGVHKFLNEIKSFTENDPNEDLLLELAKITAAQFEDPAFGFQLLLPDPEADLNQRSRAIGEWCQGFIYGIGLERPKLDEETAEFIGDLAEFSRIDHDILAEDSADDTSDNSQENAEENAQENEIALEELIEFIRMGAILTHHNLIIKQKGLA
ncbi:hypothetical protein AwWohl_10340 [Gammaproteobacteria bacterium]|nr:hypothetical protein AwWohl_10340 [Gammaproteobacteria bacterium]